MSEMLPEYIQTILFPILSAVASAGILLCGYAFLKVQRLKKLLSYFEYRIEAVSPKAGPDYFH